MFVVVPRDGYCSSLSGRSCEADVERGPTSRMRRAHAVNRNLVQCLSISWWCGEGDAAAADLLQDGVGAGGPDEGFGLGVVGLQVALDGGDQVGDGVEHSATQGLVGQVAEPSLDEVEPGTGRGREVQTEARVLGQPALDVGVLVGGVVVQDQMNVQALGGLPVDGLEELQELLVAVSR